MARMQRFRIAIIAAAFLGLPLFGQSQLQKVEMIVDGVDCEACALGIKAALKKVGGIQNLSVDVKSGTLRIEPAKDKMPSLRSIENLLAFNGFTPRRTTVQLVGEVVDLQSFQKNANAKEVALLKSLRQEAKKDGIAALTSEASDHLLLRVRKGPDKDSPWLVFLLKDPSGNGAKPYEALKKAVGKQITVKGFLPEWKADQRTKQKEASPIPLVGIFVEESKPVNSSS